MCVAGRRSAVLLLAAMAIAAASPAAAQLPPPIAPPQLPLVPADPLRPRVLLDCGGCFASYLREEVDFVDYVRDRTQADIHVLITRAGTGAGGTEYTASFIGAGRFDGTTETIRTATGPGDTDDMVRTQLASLLRSGLLRFLTRETLPPGFEVLVSVGQRSGPPTPSSDPWNNWVFSLQGSLAFEGEESNNERRIGFYTSADRITPNWKITIGGRLDHRHEEFDLDEDAPVKVDRREQDFRWLIVKALGDHWSVGAQGDVESSTYENTRLAVAAAPAIEYNFFPYSMYTRRQLRAQYGVGVRYAEYYEETLYGKLEETLPQHELSLTYEQREPWGTLEARTEWSQYLNDLSKSRLEMDAEVSVRVARGFSVATEVSTSRIRDQLSLPARGVTEEEVLLRLRQLQSGYEYEASVRLIYTFGSIFSSIVNPRFGQ